MMLITKAQQLLKPFHNAVVVCVVPTLNGINGQLSTGLETKPFLSITDGQVCGDEVFDCLLEHEANWDNTQFSSPLIPTFDLSNMDALFGLV